MTDSVCFVPSSNGYGHLRRVSSIAKALKESKEVKTTLVWNKEKEFPQGIFPNGSFDKIVFSQTPLLFDGPRIIHEIKDNSSKKNLGDLFSSYDIVLSDTLTWPLRVRNDAMFLGQFTWEFYHQRLEYGSGISELSASNFGWLENPAFSMGEFTWDEMSHFTKLVRLPVFDYWNIRNQTISKRDEILVSFSGTKSFSEQSKEIGCLNFAPRAVRGLENYIRENGQKPLGIICRPGLGIISECISAKVIPIIVKVEDPEMVFNRKILIDQLEIAVDFEQIQNLTQMQLFEFLINFESTIRWPEVISSSEFARKYIVKK